MPCCFSWWRWRDGGGAYDGIAWPGLFMPMTISSVLGQPAGLVPRITPCWRRSWPGCLGCGRCPNWGLILLLLVVLRRWGRAAPVVLA